MSGAVDYLLGLDVGHRRPGRRHRLLHGRRPGPDAGRPAARRHRRLRAVLRRDPVGARPARLVAARRPRCSATSPRRTASSPRSWPRELEAAAAGPGQGRASSSSTPGSTTPSSTTPGPRSTTRPRPSARWDRDRCRSSAAQPRADAPRWPTPAARSTATSSSGCGSAVTSTASSTPTTARRAVAARVAAEPLVAPAALAADAGRPDRRPRRRRRRARARRRPPALAAGPGRRAAHRRPASWPASRSATPTRSSSATACARPCRDEDEFEAAHRRLDEVLPGSGPLAERYVAWREAQAIPPDEAARRCIDSLADDFRERTERLFGLPDGEHVDWELGHRPAVVGLQLLPRRPAQPGGHQHRPARCSARRIAHLVAHEAYPGHHTEHTRKEVGLVRARGHHEETIFLVGTPQCLLAEGLADLGLEVIARASDPSRSWPSTCARSASPTTPRSWPRCRVAGEALDNVRGNVAFLLHEDGALGRRRRRLRRALGSGAAATGPRRCVEFLTDPDVAGLHLLLRRGPAAVPARSSPATRPASPACSTSSCCPTDLAAAA